MLKTYLNALKHAAEKKPEVSKWALLIPVGLKLIASKYRSVKMRLTKNSTFDAKNQLRMCSLFPSTILELTVKHLHPKSILDVGCGTGISLNWFLQNNIDALGIENSEVAISQSLVKNKILKHNLNKTLALDRKFDLVWCYEVIEHIHPQYESIFLQTLTRHSDQVILSAARPGQGGHGHFNEQEPAYWKKRFDDAGFDFQSEFSLQLQQTDDVMAENIMYFKRRTTKNADK